MALGPREQALREMREAQAKAVTPALSHAKRVTKSAVTKPIVSLLKKPKVPKGTKVGRPLKGDHPMTSAEKMRALRERRQAVVKAAGTSDGVAEDTRAVSQTPSLAEKGRS